MIVIPGRIAADMVGHAREQAPVEACGLLAGSEGRARRLYKLTNVDGSADHFSLDPREQFAAAKDIRTRGSEMIALYHSHPSSPALMSPEDLRLAFTPGVCYVVVSLLDPDRPDIRGFRIESGRPVEVPILIEEREE